MIDDHGYWNEFYLANRAVREPSSFARHVEDRYFQRGTTLLELGCGNGRDAIFFAEKEKQVSALDLSLKSIQSLSAMNVKNAEFFYQDFSQLSDFKNFDYVYSRFTLHSIDDESENMVFQQLPKVLKSGGLFLLEARSLKDEKLAKTFGTDHFRRYLDYEATVNKIERLNFKVLEKIESQGLSPYKEEDPFLMRIVAKKL
ncbi:UbiE/COQ5 methyltransferase family protein [Candidatus Nitrotoga sp. BS]|uniref:class I SAM-dependent methyltransferase n=1 Tax=Candidatus Nitrotoga sp. BS TaxID=2890408 RepID=UPI001EF1F4BF|nr:class I SAM-dependent methyltransferase [Candidatus Nitrotoga sp. BS]CAH1202369.1 UbiE/COQ5 methyltransferase family protein [Candidatus Nitrotoga sp. BS]